MVTKSGGKMVKDIEKMGTPLKQIAVINIGIKKEFYTD
jgi:hypothetical protein